MDRDELIAAMKRWTNALGTLQGLGYDAVDLGGAFRRFYEYNVNSYSDTTPGRRDSRQVWYWLRNETTGQVLRGKLNGEGHFPIAALTPNTLYRARYYQAQQNLFGQVTFESADSGLVTEVPRPMLLPLDPSSPDTDNDGLPDAAEDVIGTSSTLWSTPGNGISDGAAVRQGLDPFGGGSDGGGGASNDNTNGGNGGGGGGAILIASSRDITLNGVIRANGGNRQWSGASQGCRGSGGGILLRADRISGPGSVEAYGGDSNNPNGRIRVEAYARALTGSQNPIAVVGLPAANGELNQVGTLTITSVAGQNVVQPPTGNPQTPDVIFSQAGSIAVQITGKGIPDNTPVKLRINTGNSVIVAGPANMVGGAVTINATVPKGVGTLQATAEFTQ